MSVILLHLHRHFSVLVLSSVVFSQYYSVLVRTRNGRKIIRIDVYSGEFIGLGKKRERERERGGGRGGGEWQNLVPGKNVTNLQYIYSVCDDTRKTTRKYRFVVYDVI